MKWGYFGQAVGGLVLLGSGLYGAYLVGRTHAPAASAPVMHDEYAGLRKQLGDYSRDGRAGTKCGSPNYAVCEISLIRLITLPERFHGKQVLVTGLLVYGGYGAMLYPSENSARYDLGDGIELGGFGGAKPPRFIPEALWPRLEKGVWVSLVGTFDASLIGGGHLTVGAMHDVHYVEDLYDYWPAPASPPTPILKSIPPGMAKPPQFETQPDTP